MLRPRGVVLPLVALLGDGGRLLGWRGYRVGEASNPGPYTVGGLRLARQEAGKGKGPKQGSEPITSNVTMKTTNGIRSK